MANESVAGRRALSHFDDMSRHLNQATGIVDLITKSSDESLRAASWAALDLLERAKENEEALWDAITDADGRA